MAIRWLSQNNNVDFPDLALATDHGLLAAGGDLSVNRLISAYKAGIFPWFNAHDPILWWSPDPRMVLFTDALRISKNLNKKLRQAPFKVTFDKAFADVIKACAAPRQQQEQHDTWIHPDMIRAYDNLHAAGYAHSVECWLNDELVGGLYGVAIGNMFFGESMFSFVTDSSKIALTALVQQLTRWGWPMIDCQVHSDHLARLGAVCVPRTLFVQQIQSLCQSASPSQKWQLDADLPHAI
ncbi:Leucyl/phenylalanyl-tRNA--protein transferase [Methylophaga frappieri]|uniref:Leucyl/phenylalanyl-tRNA--protein transferase n=1 Tax=Methylophaga frappieri (strain ATCC BAA-2434 / DSM 25690 / JAM7) TaxID=754477 RepID=I1YFV5_METFJ|nr:leucyl/phenylalanyl-tRNA--protein transferase [Methylophaga frappieri]AFJ01798.1 Leucyl/phenylalanyl-tRNA--protein transferase [Methylophaga frappieri]